MKGWKKVISGVVVLVLLLSVMAGCAGKEPEPNTPEPTTSAPEATVQSNNAEEDLFAKMENTTKIVWLHNNFRNAPEGNSLITHVQERLLDELNIELELITVPGANYKEKANLLMVSGEQIDLMGFYGLTYDDFVQYAGRGGLTDLTDLYHKYRSEISWVVQGTATDRDDLEILKYASIEDRIYGIGIHQPVAQTLTFMRKDWLDKLGYDLKDGDDITIEQFYEIAKAFKEKDPDGNNANDTTGMIGIGGDYIQPILGAFGVTLDYYLINDNNQIVCTNVEQNMRDALEFIQKMYKEGLIHRDSPVMKTAQIREAAANGAVGIVGNNWTFRNIMQNTLKQKDIFPDSEWIGIGAVTGTENLGVKGAAGYKGRDPIMHLHSIPANSKNAEAAMKTLAFMYSDEELYRTISFGVPELHHNYSDAEGIVFTTEGESVRDAGWSTAYRTLETHATNPKLPGEKSIIDTKFPENAQYYRLAALQPKYENAFYGIVTEEFLEYSTDLDTRREEVFAKILYGEEPITSFDEWVNFWKSNGGPEILEAGVKTYNERFGTNYSAKQY